MFLHHHVLKSAVQRVFCNATQECVGAGNRKRFEMQASSRDCSVSVPMRNSEV